MVVQWWKEEEEGSRHLLFEGLVFDSLGKVPETSSPPLWPSIKGEAVKNWAKRIALHQRNWKKKLLSKENIWAKSSQKLHGLPLVASDSIDSDLLVYYRFCPRWWIFRCSLFLIYLVWLYHHVILSRETNKRIFQNFKLWSVMLIDFQNNRAQKHLTGRPKLIPGKQRELVRETTIERYTKQFQSVPVDPFKPKMCWLPQEKPQTGGKSCR